MAQIYEIEWPGWSLENNKYGDEFDADARVRMIETGRKLIPYLLDLNGIDNLNMKYLEIGPFFTPLLFSEELIDLLPNKKSRNFIDNDPNVINYIKNQFDCNILDLDINSKTFSKDLKKKIVNQMGVSDFLFDNIIISQILNYIDYKLLLQDMYIYLSKSGHVFINNVVDYGIPKLFSVKRPKSNQEIINTAVALGYKVKLKEELSKTFNKEPHDRLILILTK